MTQLKKANVPAQGGASEDPLALGERILSAVTHLEGESPRAVARWLLSEETQSRYPALRDLLAGRTQHGSAQCDAVRASVVALVAHGSLRQTDQGYSVVSRSTGHPAKRTARRTTVAAAR